MYTYIYKHIMVHHIKLKSILYVKKVTNRLEGPFCCRHEEKNTKFDGFNNWFINRRNHNIWYAYSATETSVQIS